MNKHMKEHSRRLNIKTTQLASLTAVFRLKKRKPPIVDDPRPPAMDVDEEGHPPPDSQVGGSGITPERPTLQVDGNETDDDSGGNTDGTSEGMLMDLDSTDEFESDEEDVDNRRDRAGKG
jgi:hypothetical protein